jgi:hypothetical protein
MARAAVPNPAGLGGKRGKVDASDVATQQSPYARALNENNISRRPARPDRRATFQRLVSRSTRPMLRFMLCCRAAGFPER